MEQERKGEVSIGMYTYNHNSDSGFDVHEIYVKRSRFRVLLSYIGMVFLLASVCQLYLSKEGLSTGSVWSIAFGILVAKCLQYKPVKKESVVIMPTFGVQLEIHFWSGRVHRRFVPIGKILKPLLNECVTPVTCYWSLALLLRDEEELRLVFQSVELDAAAYTAVVDDDDADAGSVAVVTTPMVPATGSWRAAAAAARRCEAWEEGSTAAAEGRRYLCLTMSARTAASSASRAWTCCCKVRMAPMQPYTGSRSRRLASYTRLFAASPRWLSCTSCNDDDDDG
uniref:Phosphatidylinositol N-acetylglucosaminyltransferase subunit H conserved domain-containing protein n=1 Tax=Oryza nivara TaxID=4536 RepID=A0A0E0HA30_ORYNI